MSGAENATPVRGGGGDQRRGVFPEWQRGAWCCRCGSPRPCLAYDPFLQGGPSGCFVLNQDPHPDSLRMGGHATGLPEGTIGDALLDEGSGLWRHDDGRRDLHMLIPGGIDQRLFDEEEQFAVRT